MTLLVGACLAVNLVHAQMAEVRGLPTSHLLPRTYNLAQFAVAGPTPVAGNARVAGHARVAGPTLGRVVEDNWFGIDKVKHFFISAFIESVSYSSLQAAHVNHRSALAGAIGVTVAFGVGREIHDSRNPKNHFSIKDLSWDAIGAGAGVVLSSHTIR